MIETVTEFDAFREVYDQGRAQVVSRSLVADLETPVGVYLKLAHGRPYSFLLESVEGGETRGRYSIIGAKPDLIWRCHGDRPEINRRARADLDSFAADDRGALDSFRAILEESRIDLPADLPPMAAGLVGYFGYDTVRLIEHLPNPPPDALGLPDGLFSRPTLMAIFDSVKDALVLVTPVRPEPGISAESAYARAQARLDDAAADLDRPPRFEAGAASAPDIDAVLEPVSNTSKARYFEMIDTAKAYVAAGDIFQVVPSQRFSVPFALDPFALYRALRRLNPSPFLYYLELNGFSVVGSSPEILVRLRDGKITIRPIAGTKPRGKTPALDKQLERDLLADPKERAEHLMLLDLGRNDVGRVAKIGTVKVTEQFVIERYSHVMHIISNVEGQALDGIDAISALIAGFPAGTVSGAPKVRAMEIIDELETEKRGIYAGGVGYFSANGSMDTAIVLRTGLVKDGRLYVQAGGGVVYDSDPESEYQETVNKARAVLRAAEDALRTAADIKRGQ
jgi:anthranilate synthase component 1